MRSIAGAEEGNVTWQNKIPIRTQGYVRGKDEDGTRALTLSPESEVRSREQ